MPWVPLLIHNTSCLHMMGLFRIWQRGKKFKISLSGNTIPAAKRFYTSYHNSLSLKLLKLQMEPVQNGFSSLEVKSTILYI
jgi:hypothetical protein